MKSFKTPIQIHFDDTDAAGICFFGNVFKKVHIAYEQFIAHLGLDSREWFLDGELTVPIRHIETDFLKPLLPFQNYEMEVSVNKVSQHSFQMSYEIFQDSESCGSTIMTHIFCTKESMEKCPIPEGFRDKLLPYLKNPTA